MAQQEEWDGVAFSYGSVIIYSDEAFYSPDSATLSAKNALKLLKWLEEHREELGKLASQGDEK